MGIGYITSTYTSTCTSWSRHQIMVSHANTIHRSCEEMLGSLDSLVRVFLWDFFLFFSFSLTVSQASTETADITQTDSDRHKHTM